MNPNFNQFRKEITNPFKYRLFKFTKLPSAFFAGVKIEQLDETKAVVSIQQSWFNKNPFNSIYFAMLAMAAEVSTGVLCMGHIYKRKPPFSMLVIKSESLFYKKATGKILFTCPDGASIAKVVEDALASGEGKTVICHSSAINKEGELVAEFYCTWSLKAKSTAV